MTTQENAIRRGECCLGIELGSTRIKAVLIDETHAPAAMGVYDWENRLENGVWTYHMEDVWQGSGRVRRPARKCETAVRRGTDPSCGNRRLRHDARLSAV